MRFSSQVTFSKPFILRGGTGGSLLLPLALFGILSLDQYSSFPLRVQALPSTNLPSSSSSSSIPSPISSVSSSPSSSTSSSSTMMNTASLPSSTSSTSWRAVSMKRVEHALWGFFAGDAIAAPTHWMYGGFRQVQQYYGYPNGVQDYVKPTHQFAGSILNKSNLMGGGRSAGSGTAPVRPRNQNEKEAGETGQQSLPPTIVGHVILHGKQDLWSPNREIHYHATLQRGENTLEASLGRVLLRSITETLLQRKGSAELPKHEAGTAVLPDETASTVHWFDPDHFRTEYMHFMMTPGTHNDTYASTCHRMFFANLIYQNRDSVDCPDNDRHNVDAIDGLVLPTLVSLAGALREDCSLSQVQDAAQACVAVTRNSPVLEQAARAWAELVYTLVRRRSSPSIEESVCTTTGTDSRGGEELSLTQSAQRVAQKLGLPRPRVTRQHAMTACYLDSSLPALLDVLVSFDQQQSGTATAQQVWQCLLENANTGGENVHRGSCLGAILGLVASPEEDWSASPLVRGLYHREPIEDEIKVFLQAVTEQEHD